MAIKRASDATAVIEPGKFILSGSALVYGICGKAGRITTVSGKRVYYERLKGEEAGKITHVNDDKIVFICDTLDEVEKLMAINEAAVVKTSAAVAAVEKEHADRFSEEVSAVIAGAV